MGFARKGAKLARDAHPKYYSGASAVKEIENDPEVIEAKGEVFFIKADTREYLEMKQAIQTIVSHYGTLDIAINDAGIGGFLGSMDEIPENFALSEHDPIKNNLYGTFNSMRAETEYWNNHTIDGIIVNLSSYNGIRSCPTCSMYSASKYGIIGLTKSVALEYINGSPRIRVNAIAPGLIDTFLTRNQVNYITDHKQVWDAPLVPEDSELWQKYKDTFANNLQGKRLGKPEELANAIIFLCGPQAEKITGSVFPVDDGSSAF
ncbi:dehydrogenase [Anaeramoeba flamelloides]|uniref:Dehydrogenase n=1 Tax=Anaeramoeba flamelloides TaxID=1746091 RepID=A0ABQ8YQX8_9EUKA|nr:dehydrogenase [Anaeramoeba flamelloides]